MMNRDFLREVFEGNKNLLALTEVVRINVPKYDELSAKEFWNRFKDDAKVKKYLPDHYAVGKYPDRTYLFNIINTVHPEYLDKVIRHAQTQRYASG